MAITLLFFLFMHISSIHVMLVPVYLSTIPLTSILKHIQCVELYKWICKTRDASYLLGLLILSQPCMHSFWVELCDTVLARANLLVDPLKHQSDFCLVYPVDAPPWESTSMRTKKLYPRNPLQHKTEGPDFIGLQTDGREQKASTPSTSTRAPNPL